MLIHHDMENQRKSNQMFLTGNLQRIYIFSVSYPYDLSERVPKLTNMNGECLCVTKRCSQNSGEKPLVKLIQAPKLICKLCRQTFNLAWLRIVRDLVWNGIFQFVIFAEFSGVKKIFENWVIFDSWFIQNSYEWLVTLKFCLLLIKNTLQWYTED